MAMQQQFFAGYETLGWVVNSAEEVKPGIVLFDFSFSGKTLDGKAVNRDGLEYVIIHNNKIQHIEVKNKN